MATTRRFSYSLLISTVAFGVFAVVAFSGLFPWIEAQFYSPRIVADVQQKLSVAETGIDAWKTAQISKLDKLLSDDSFNGVFSPTQNRDALQRRFQAAKLFLLGVRGGGSVRIFNGDFTQLHFSTEDADVKARTDFTIAYHFPSELSGLPDFKAAGVSDGNAHVLLDPSGRALVFARPWKDSAALISGWAVLTVSLEDLRLSLVEGGVGLADQPVAALTASSFVFGLAGTSGDVAVIGRVRDLAVRGVLPPVQRLAVTGGPTGPLTLALVHEGSSNAVILASRLELDFVLKIIILLSFYTVLFLIVFLLFNLRGEPISAVSRRVKRFQLQVVRQYLDLKEQDKIRSLRDELTRHSAEIRSGIRRSIGHVRRKDREWVDRYIDTSWQEVLDLLRGPEPPPETASNADWKRLEALLQQALTQGRFVVSGAPAAAPVSARPAPAPAARKPVPDAEDAEELEEAEELEDADVEELEAEPADELEADVEDVEAVEELEEAEPADDVEELEEADAAEAEAVEELEEAEELEELEPETVDAEAALLTVPSRPQRQAFPARSAGTGTAVLPGLQQAEELEELDAPEELEEFEAAEVEELEASAEEPAAEWVSYDLDALDGAWKPASDQVFQESGEVVSLTDDVFTAEKNGHDEFGQLVSEVLAGPDTTFVPLKEDLVPEQRTREWRWTGGGFDWDRFAGADDDVSLFRALSDAVTAFDAFTAAIIVADGTGWKAQSSVGFSDAGKERLEFAADSPFGRNCLSVRALHVLGGASPLLSSFHDKDLKFLKTLACIPLLFRHEPAWLLLGLRQSPNDVLAVLAPRRIG